MSAWAATTGSANWHRLKLNTNLERVNELLKPENASRLCIQTRGIPNLILPSNGHQAQLVRYPVQLIGRSTALSRPSAISFAAARRRV
jgi:hypothetical protein